MTLRHGLHKTVLPIAQQTPHRVRLFLLFVLAEHVNVFCQHLADVFFVLAGVDRDYLHLGAFGQTAPERVNIQPQLFVESQINDAARHPRTEPGAGIAQGHTAPRGHVFERESFDVCPRSDTTEVVGERPAQFARDDQIGAREPDARARIGVALHDQRPTLRAVAEAFADRTVETNAVVVHAFEHGDCAAAARFSRAVLHAPFDDDVDALNVVGAQAVARNRAFGEMQLGQFEMRRHPVLVYRARKFARQARAQASVNRRDLVVLEDRDRFALLDQAVDFVRNDLGQRSSRAVRSTDVIFAQLFGLEGFREFDALEQVFEVNLIESASLLHQVGATDQFLGAVEPESHRPDADLVDDLFEKCHQRINRFVVIARRVFLEARFLRLLERRMVRGDAHVAGALVAFAAARASDRGHRHRAETHAVCAEQHQLDVVRARFDAPVGPDLDAFAQPRLEQGPMSLFNADLDRHSDVAQSMFSRRPGASVVTADGDDVGARLGDARGDRADGRQRGDLGRDLRMRVGGLQFGDHLRQIFDRVDVVIVGRREQIDALRRVASPGDQLGDFHSGQVSAFTGLRALADLDLDEVGAVEQMDVDAETPRSHLLAAILLVPAHHIGDFAAFTVHRDDFQTFRRFGVRAEGRFALRAERHRRDEDRRAMIADLRVGEVARDDRSLLQIEQVAQRNGRALFDLRQFMEKVVVAFLFARDLARRAPDVRLAAVFAHESRRAAQAGRALPGLFAA